MTEHIPLRTKHEAALAQAFADESVPNSARTLLNALLSDIDDLESDRDSAEEDADTLRDEVECRDSDQDRALVEVKYWLYDFFDARLRDPRRLLRMVEEVL